MTSPVAYGIDFGTTNSAISIAYPDRSELVPLGPSGADVMPSVIYLDATRQRLAGDLAVQAYGVSGHQNTTRLMSSIKSFLADPSWTGTLAPWGERLAPEHLVAIILKNLKAAADRYCGTATSRVVLGHPVLFVGAEGSDFAERQQLALDRLRLAAENAGFTEIAFCDEASAALSPEWIDDGIVVALDFGGGTFDINVEQVVDGRRTIRASHGAAIGGERFDRLLFDRHIGSLLGLGRSYSLHGTTVPVGFRLQRMNTLHGILSMVSDSLTMTSLEHMYQCSGGEIFRAIEKILYGGHGYNFYRTVESTKITLSEQSTATFTFRRPGIDLSTPIKRAWFEQLISADLDLIEDKVRLALRDAGVTPSQVTTVIRTGGSSSIPAFVDRMTRVFGRGVLQDRDPFATVALGLGLRALEVWR